MRSEAKTRVGGTKAGAALCAEARGERIAEFPAAMHLQRDVEVAPAAFGKESQQRLEARFALGKSGEAGERKETVDVLGKARYEFLRPRQTDQRDLGMRKKRAQRTKGRDGAKKIAELERPEDRNAPGR